MTTANKHAEPCPGLPNDHDCDSHRAGLIAPRAFFGAVPDGYAELAEVAVSAGFRFSESMVINDLRYIEDRRRMGRLLPTEDPDAVAAYMPAEDFLARRWRWSARKVRTWLRDRLRWADHTHFDKPVPRRPRKGGRRSTAGLCGVPAECDWSVGGVWAECRKTGVRGFSSPNGVPAECGRSVGGVSAECLAGAGFAPAHNSQPHRAQEHTPSSSGVVSPPSVHEPPAPEPPPPPAPPPADPSPPQPEPGVSSGSNSASGGEPLGGAWSGRRVVRSWTAAYQQVHGVSGPLGRRGRGIAKTLAGKLNARLNPPTAAQLVAGMVDYLQHQAAGRAFPWLKDEPHATRPAIGHFAGDENLSRFFPDNPPAWTGQEWDWTSQGGAGEPEPDPDPPAVVWTAEDLAIRERLLEMARRRREARVDPHGMAAK